ncbi:MAG: hypothetical protein LIO77_07705 [Rikenellaceae bacterium]|nr:hypothetical protein [Rikenellaceae bacterium]
MKKILTIGLLLTTFNFIQAQPGSFIPGYDKEQDDEAADLFPPYESVHSGRELPRSFTVVYPDEDSALRGSLEPSLYLQPLTDEPRISDTGTHTEYSWNYKVPFAWVGRMVSLYVGSVDNPYSVTVNGETAGNNQSSRSAAEFDLTALSKEGINTLTIRVEKNPAASVLTANAGSGKITGKVFIQSQPRIRIRDFVYRANFTSDEPTLELGIILKTQMLNPRSVRIHYSLRDRDGTMVSSGYRDARVGLKEEDTVRFFLTVKELRPWTYETPNTYDLTVRNQYEGRYTEYVNYHTGFRDLRMSEGDLYTNGYRLPLSWYMPRDIPAKENLRDYLTGIKNNGYNILVVPHHPLDEDFYRACDDVGIYVCNQADIDTSASGSSRASDGNPSNDPRWAASYVDRAVTMYGSSAHHPSVALFSIARNSSNGYNLYKSYLALKAMETARPVVYPEAGGEWNSDAIVQLIADEFPQSIGGRMILKNATRSIVYPQKPYAVTSLDNNGKCRVENNSFVTTLRGKIEYTVKKGSRKIAEGAIPVVLDPGTSGDFIIPVPESTAGKKLKYESRLVSNFDGF